MNHSPSVIRQANGSRRQDGADALGRVGVGDGGSGRGLDLNHHLGLLDFSMPGLLARRGRAAAGQDRRTVGAAQGLSLDQAHFILARQVTTQGYILAATEIYHLCALAFLLLIVLVWLARPETQAKKPAEPAFKPGAVE